MDRSTSIGLPSAFERAPCVREQLKGTQRLADAPACVRRNDSSTSSSSARSAKRASSEGDGQLDRVERRDLALPRLPAAFASIIQRPRHAFQEVRRGLGVQGAATEELRQEPRCVLLGLRFVGGRETIQLVSSTVL